MLFGFTLRDYARRTSRAITFSAAGAVLVAIGLGFLTAAFWMMLAELRSAIFAAQVVGFLYTGAGLILFAVARAQRRLYRAPPAAPAAATVDPFMKMIEGFLIGLDAGRRTSRPKRR
ncbi:phage holin family protein [Puniceibacterium confluentis]|uniref:phage holin family protein n=1 Tax=Puniceibacterium confluentis TaxID=1958944 RepID=UPI0011B5F604|nr:phage holin family protein [Puniceibacterium confluentis]